MERPKGSWKNNNICNYNPNIMWHCSGCLSFMKMTFSCFKLVFCMTSKKVRWRSNGFYLQHVWKGRRAMAALSKLEICGVFTQTNQFYGCWNAEYCIDCLWQLILLGKITCWVVVKPYFFFHTRSCKNLVCRNKSVFLETCNIYAIQSFFSGYRTF